MVHLSHGISCDDRLLGKHALPLRLFNSEGFPVTDYHGYPLKTINGVTLVVQNKLTDSFEDIKGFPLLDAEGRSPNDQGYKPEMVPIGQVDLPDPFLDEEGKPQLLYNVAGIPLTDSSGRALCDSKGKLLVLLNVHKSPVSDIYGQQLLDISGKPLHGSNHLCNSNKYNNVTSPMFDEKGFPLTDSKGQPLRDIKGKVLINLNCDGFPTESTYGSQIYDVHKRFPSADWSEKFQKLSKRKAFIKDGDGDLILLFDAKGFPITDSYGQILLQINGIPLYYYDEKHSFLDRYGFEAMIIKKDHYNPQAVCSIKNSEGVGGRLFNVYGKPLTDQNGEVLTTAFGMLLVRFNPLCQPSSDWEGSPIYDMWGHQVGSTLFNPYPSKDLLLEESSNDKKLRSHYPPMFDVTSMPLVDAHGRLLRNAKDKIMVIIDSQGNPKSDLKGRRIYDKYGLPLVSDLNEPLLGPRDQPAHLFDVTGYPLTGPTGLVLRSLAGEHFIAMNKMGFIKSMSSIGPVCDAKGREMTKYLFNPYKAAALKQSVKKVTNLDGSPLSLYNKKGRPVTDPIGQTLFSANGESLIIVSDVGLRSPYGEDIYSIDGKVLSEISYCMEREYGFSLFTQDGQTMTDIQGNALRTKNGKPCVIFDYSGFPICDMFDRPLYDVFGVKIERETDCQPRILKVIPNVKEIRETRQVYDKNGIPLLHHNGVVLANRNGKPSIIFDSKGRPVSDMRGDPIFDERGIPLGSVGGQWLDANDNPFRLFDSKQKPVTDEKGRTLYDIANHPLVQRDEIGRPLVGSGGKRIYDANSNPTTAYDFNGITPPPPNLQMDNRASFLLKNINKLLDEHLTAIYDKCGHPLTDTEGKTLVDAAGKPMLIASDDFSSITDINGGRVFDQYKLPIGCRVSRPICSMENKPIYLFDNEGCRLTDIDGTPIKRANDTTLLVFDQIGRPTKTFYGHKLYDSKGKERGNPKFDPESNTPCYRVLMLGNQPIETYDEQGYPVTSPRGLITGIDELQLDEFDAPVLISGEQLYDKYGEVACLLGCEIRRITSSNL